MSSDEQLLSQLTLAAEPEGAAILDRMARRLVLQSLVRISRDRLVVVEGQRTMAFGAEHGEVTATLRVHALAFYRRIALGGTIGAGEAYMDGLWSCADLPALIRIMVRNRHVQDRLEGGMARLAGVAQRLLHRLNDNTLRGSRRNIAAHYDLGNDFYKQFLDPTMAYSCGVFNRPDSTLHEASLAKFDRICDKLGLAAGMSLVEIGTGWGGFALHAARHYGCRVTTTTISREQHDYAAAQIAAAGLGERVSLLRKDYRELQGQFDRLVSIEMIEAVGHRHLPTFFRACDRLLNPDGMALLQVITIPDRTYPRYRKTPDFINRHIFPGGCCPSLAAMSAAAAEATDLALVDLEDLTPHYVLTLQHWRRAFRAHLDAVRALGYDERFVRMWDYYLAYCEGGFSERFTGLLQLLYAKPSHRFGAWATAARG